MSFILVDSGGVGRRDCFVVLKLKLTSFDGFVDICFLFTTIIGCTGSVFVAMSLLVLFGDGLVRGHILVFLVLHGHGMLEFLLLADVLGTGMWDIFVMLDCLAALLGCLLLKC